MLPWGWMRETQPEEEVEWACVALFTASTSAGDWGLKCVSCLPQDCCFRIELGDTYPDTLRKAGLRQQPWVLTIVLFITHICKNLSPALLNPFPWGGFHL